MITIKNGCGLTAEFTKKGAALASLCYGKRMVASRGVTVGRYANRLAKGRFCIEDNMYQITINENENALHGGKEGFQYREWKAELLDSLGLITNDEADALGVRFSLVSSDGDQGFPGKLNVSVTYTLTESNELIIKYEAKSDKDTVINLTNHSYFNMNGGGDVHDQDLWVDTDYYTEVDEELIPTGRVLPTKGTDFELSKGGRFRANLDTNFVLNGTGLRLAAILKGHGSNMMVSCYTDRPGIQIYNTDGEVCMETQNFPDAPNHPDFPSALLRAGEVFRSTTIYKFSKQ